MIKNNHYLRRELYALLKRDDTVFEFLQLGSLDGIWYWDMEEPENEWLSPRFWEILGYDPADKKHLASEWQELIHQGDLKVALDNLARHCQDPNHPYDQIVRYRHKDGSTIWVRCRGIVIRNAAGKPHRLLGAHTDLTLLKRSEESLRSQTQERKRAEEALRKSERSLAEAQRLAHLGSWEWDTQPNVVRWSDELYRIFGIAPADFAGTFEGVLERVHPDDRACLREAVDDALQRQKPYSIDLRILLPTGEERSINSRGAPKLDDDGRVMGLIGTVLDITQRKQAEEAQAENIFLRQEIRLTREHEEIVGDKNQNRGVGLGDLLRQGQDHRHGQRAAGARHPQVQPPKRPADDYRQLRLPAALADRERAVRPRERRLHGRPLPRDGPLRAGTSIHSVFG